VKIGAYTQYLTARRTNATNFTVKLQTAHPNTFLQAALSASEELKYSPIMPAFLTQGVEPTPPPQRVFSITFLFHYSPYRALSQLKRKLKKGELQHVYFTEGLASILILNLSLGRAKVIRKIIGICPLEYWPLTEASLNTSRIVIKPVAPPSPQDTVKLPSCPVPELGVYVEQISSSITSLWESYGQYLPSERQTLKLLVLVTNKLVKQYSGITASIVGNKPENLTHQRKANSIVSALVELSATLSYAVTQGTSGAAPILGNRSPFPHHSLLGVGGSIRALIRYTRYLESAFKKRSAGKVILDHYVHIKEHLPVNITTYSSGLKYKFPDPGSLIHEAFDKGSNFPDTNQLPLIAHFSLRHGFMESKFSVTAASEALTAETMPQWTLMTLSHEIMHSRVRAIFHALFGRDWHDDDATVIDPKSIADFTKWLNARPGDPPLAVTAGLRNVILNFCYAMEKAANPIARKDDKPGKPIPTTVFLDTYSLHKQLAVEIAVHFHDFYFAYACQRKTYLMSIWASWIKVAAPFSRCVEYLVRSLATVACGTGLAPNAAYDASVELLTDALQTLESRKISSPLFDEIRRLMTDATQSEIIRAYFRVFYYLADHFRLYFASSIIAKRIDRIEQDQFSEGSVSAGDYSSNIYSFPDDGADLPSPIRYSTAALFRSLSGQKAAADPQWLTAWNYMVISS
jgi:hypothetical protein